MGLQDAQVICGGTKGRMIAMNRYFVKFLKQIHNHSLEKGEQQMANRCVYNSKEYSDGAELSQGGKLMQCRDGSWVETGEICKSYNTKSCVFFPTGYPGTMGLLNKSDHCKVAIIRLIYLDGHPEIKEFEIEANSVIKVDIKGTIETEIINVLPCNK
jgi:hypothetical protein